MISKKLASILTLSVLVLSAQTPTGLNPNTEIAKTSASAKAGESGSADTLLSNPKAQDVAKVEAKLDAAIARPFEAAATNFRVDCAKAKPGVEPFLKHVYATEMTDQNSPASRTSGAGQFHVLVHILGFNEDLKPLGFGCMYVAKRTGAGFEVTSGSRIYGSNNVAVAFVLLNQPAAAAVDSFSVFYRVVIEKKLAQNIANLFAALQLPTIPLAKSANRAAFYGRGFVENVDVPSDIYVVAGHVVPVEGGEKEAPLVNKLFQFDNEGRHTWDVSVGVPVTKATGLEYVENSSSFTARSVNKQTLYAMFNFFPFNLPRGVDLKQTKSLRFALLAGIGVTGRPGDRLFLGGGLGAGFAQVFAGTAITNTQYKDPADPSIVRQRYRTRLAMGVNIPVGQAIKKLTGK